MIIVFGGSFDPVHIGHLIIARDIRETFRPSRMIFIPANLAPLKETHSASAEDRLQMLRLALEGEKGVEIEEYEIRKGGISYTADTLEYLVPKIGGKPFLLLGSDSAVRLHLWKDPEKILTLSRLLIVDRGGKLDEVRKYFKENFSFLQEGRDLSFAQVRRIDISASEIRERVRNGKSIRFMVPEKVEKYIREKKLYTKV